MECIICRKKIYEKDNDICKECNKILNIIYQKNPEDKEFALRLFRENKKIECLN